MKRAFWIALIALLPLLGVAGEPSKITVYHAQGKLEQQVEGQWSPTEAKQLLAGLPIRTGEAPKKLAWEKDLKLLHQDSFVFSEFTQTVVVLGSGASYQAQLDKDKQVHYQLQGWARLIVRPADKPVVFQLNGLPFSSKGAVIYLGAGGWVLAQGEAQVVLPKIEPAVKLNTKDKKTIPKKPKKADKVLEGPVVLTSGQRLSKDKTGYQINLFDVTQDLEFKASGVAGFAGLGTYQIAGKVVFETPVLAVERNQKTAKFSNSPAVLFFGDQVQTSAGQTVQLEMDSGDLVRLDGGSSFTLEPPVVGAPLAQAYKFLGTIRARVKPRTPRRRIQFRTVTALIGVKGTDFEVTGTDQSTNVATIEGLVGVTDPQGGGEVDVPSGQMTDVPAGGLPSPPVAIEPDRLFKLRSKPVVPLAVGEGVPADAELSDPYQFERLALKQGDSLVLQLTQPLAKAELHVGSEPLPTSFEGDRLTLDTAKLFELSQSKETVEINFELESDSGGTSSFTKTIALRHKPEAAPKLNIGDGATSLHTQRVGELKVSGDRKLILWSAFLDEAPLTLPAQPDGTDELVLAAPLFAQLTEGVHQLRVEGKDDFDLTGEVKLELVVDRTGPILSQWMVIPRPGSLAEVRSKAQSVPKTETSQENQALAEAPVQAQGPTIPAVPQEIILREAEGLSLTFNEPLVSLSVKLGEITTPITLTPGALELQLAAEPWAKIFGGAPNQPFKLLAQDAQGNQGEWSGQLTIRPKPTEPLVLSLDPAVPSLAVAHELKLSLTSQRPLERITAELDGQTVDLSTFEPSLPLVAGEKLDFPGLLVSGLSEGPHQLEITGTDDFQLSATVKLELVVDLSGPKLVELVPPVHLDWFRLSQGERLTLVFNEPVGPSKAELAGKPLPLSPGGDDHSLVIEGNQRLLGTEPSVLNLMVTDLLGNPLALEGRLGLRQPRANRLQQAWDQSNLKSSADPVAQGVLATRPDFGLLKDLDTSNIEGLKPLKKGSLKEVYDLAGP